MNLLATPLNNYLKLRRQLGFKLRVQGILLRNFVRFAQQKRVAFITPPMGAGMGDAAGPHQPSAKGQSIGRGALFCQIPERD